MDKLAGKVDDDARPAPRPVELPAWDNRDLPPRYTWTLADYPTVAEAMLAWLADPKVWSLYLQGHVGSRKTSLAVAIVREFRSRFNPPFDGVSAAYFVTIDIAAQLLREQSVWFPTHCAMTKLLVIDDLGASRPTPHIVERLLFVLKDRYDREAKTIITSNLSLDDLGGAFDDRVADRLREGRVFHCGDASKREAPTS